MSIKKKLKIILVVILIANAIYEFWEAAFPVTAAITIILGVYGVIIVFKSESDQETASENDSMITLKPVTEHEKPLLWNILQKYLHEMTQYYPDEMDENGNYPYRYFDAYFSEDERIAYLIYSDEHLVGFTMLNPYSYIEHQPDHVIAEFCIFPAYRRKHLALQAAELILEKHPGKWEIKFNENNTGAKRLWEKVTEKYGGNVYMMEEEETVLEFSNQS